MTVPTSMPACAAPFTQMTLQPTGKVSPCCYHYGLELGRVQESSLMDIWNDAKLRQLRAEFLSGNPKTCRAKMQYIRCHERFSQWMPQVDPAIVQRNPPKRLDLRLNGQCNLRCVMCEVWQQPNGVWDESDLWTRGPSEIFPHLQEIDVLGGEPFIQSDTQRLIESVYAVNKTCRWNFVTNAQYRLSPALQQWLQVIPLNMVQISVDSLDAVTYQSIRNADHRLMMKTLQWFSDLHQRRRDLEGNAFDLRFSLCALKSNWREIPAFIEFCRSHHASCEIQFAHYDPSKEHSLAFLSVDEMNEVIDTLNEKIPLQDHPLIHTVIEPLRDAVEKKKMRAQRIEFDFSSSLPEPFSDTFRDVWKRFSEFSEFPDMEEINKLPERFSQSWFCEAGLRFVPQPKMGQRKRRSYRKLVQQGKAVTYDARIAQEKEIWTRRNNWHDLFAAMVWCVFPRAKYQLHCSAHGLAEANGRGKNRSEAQDYLTMFDEGGLVVPVLDVDIEKHTQAIRDIKAEDRLIYLNQHGLRAFGFGHGVLEALCLQRQFVNAMTLFIQVESSFFDLDEELVRTEVDGYLQRCLDKYGTTLRDYSYMAAVRLNPIKC